MSPAAPRLVRPYVNAIVRRAIDPMAYLPERPRPRTSEPAVGVVGFFGWGNYGDELFLEAYREHLADPIRLRTVLDPRAGRWAGRRVGSAVRASDAILIGGGDILVPWTASGRYWERAYLRRPVFVAGIGVPTWQDPDPGSVAILRRFFQHPSIRSIATRDPSSSAWIEQNLAPSVPVRTTPDLVCAITLPEVERPTDPPIFGVAVRRRARPDDLSQVRRLCERAVALGYRVRRIVLATGGVRARDLEATAELGLPDTELVSSDDLDTITRAIGECTAMASMKFHGSLVAAMYGIPSLVLVPTAKNRYFMEAIGRPDLLARFSDADLPDRLGPDAVPIPPTVRDRLRTQATGFLADLRAAILAEVASTSR